jgi:peptidoglycan/LPS O-acetylase OafA/YrhL
MNMSFMYKENNGKGEIASIVLMRGIASFLVCYFHLTNGDSEYLADSSLLKKSGEWGWIGIQIFFVISGFVIPYSMYINNYTIKNIGAFLKKRFVRIEPPYLVSIVMVLLLWYISSLMPFFKGQPFHLDWWNIAGHVAYLNAFTGAKWLQDVYWTLAIEFQFYILMAISYGLLASKNIYYRALFFVLFMSLISIKQVLPACIFGYAPYFMLGIVLFQYYCRVISLAEFWILLLSTVAFSSYFEGTVLTLIGVATILLIAVVKKVHPVFIFFGTISYSLYLVHIPLGGKFVSVATKLISPSGHVKEIISLAGIGFSIAMAWLYYILIEKRFKIMSSKIRYRNAVAS